ncbi:MAG: phosphoribosylamine--glycine ligase [Gammaproteobacteria bacterium]|nr:phosphoribosylamine--glycine ligase [Gammaproteobacteria bacterium]MBI5616303.1 phosphoribosylamine--glycine ligase [Gammaproteobacteria bacterium]
MKILIVGGGGREHALAWKAAQSPRVSQVYCAPGNAGTSREPKVQNLAIAADDVATLRDFAQREGIALTIIGPEAPLAAGVVDAFEAAGLRCFGPRRNAAVLESSKAFTKDFLARHAIPTARYGNFTEFGPAAAYIRNHPLPLVVKADGLAAGKGVVIAQTHEEALEAARGMLAGTAFGAAGRRIVVEEFLVGEEASFIVMTDGTHIVPFASSQDHKARDDGDRGPNTGGMGAYSPAPVVDANVHRRAIEEVIAPTLAGMAAEGRPYRGFLYAGLMVQPDGEPKVLEFNCRFGDPETQPIMMRLRSDLVESLLALMDGQGETLALDFTDDAAVGVVLAAGGYPDDYARGAVISGLESGDGPNVKVFHAGTALQNGAVATNGGRVLCVVGLGPTVAEAQSRAYARIDQISWTDMYCRRDIGYRAIARERGRA